MSVDTFALTVGYITLASLGVLLATFVATLVIDALKPWQKPVKPITVDRYGPFLSPHPLHRPVLHVEHAPDLETALKALEKAS